MRAKQAVKSFIFVYPEAVPAELERTMIAEGIMHYSLEEFAAFIASLEKSLIALVVVDMGPVRRDRAMLSSKPR